MSCFQRKCSFVVLSMSKVGVISLSWYIFCWGKQKLQFMSLEKKIDMNINKSLVAVFSKLVKSRILIDLFYYKSIHDLLMFETIWCLNGIHFNGKSCVFPFWWGNLGLCKMDVWFVFVYCIVIKWSLKSQISLSLFLSLSFYVSIACICVFYIALLNVLWIVQYITVAHFPF